MRTRTWPTPPPGARPHELVLLFYGRIALDSLKLDGDRRHFDRLIAWEPDE
ncbi:hypothetical protein AB0J86_04025 [Micromonospora sp. NPDC049559]|uniref:hypothetical protein n=1 Tax=Micromonospora sp. NPDC049559 TaxID=3155923 RepID=UPI00342C6106